MKTDPDLAFALGEERVVRAAGRDALWLTAVLAVVATLAVWVSVPIGTVELLLFCLSGPLFGAYVVARGGGLLSAALAAGVPVFALLGAALSLGLVGASPDIALETAGKQVALLWGGGTLAAVVVGYVARVVRRTL